MILVDANLFLYAYDAQSPMHQKARQVTWTISRFTAEV